MMLRARSMGAPVRRGARALLLAVALAVIALLTWGAGRWAVERRIGRATGLSASLAGLRLTWRPLGLELRGLVLRRRPGGPSLVAVERLAWPLFGGRRSASGVRIRLVGPAGPPRAVASGRSTGARIGLAGLWLDGATLELASAAGRRAGATSLRLPALEVRRLEAALRGRDLALSGELEVGGGRVQGWLHWHGAAGAVLASAHLRSVDLASLPVAMPGWAASGRASGRLRYERSSASGSNRRRLAGRLSLRDLRVGRPTGPALLSGVDVSVRGLSLDVPARRVSARLLRLRGGIARLRVPEREQRDTAGSPPVLAGWELRLEELDARGLVLTSAAVPELPAMRVGRLLVRGLGAGGTFELEASPSSGGAIRARGDFRASPLDVRGDFQLSAVDVGPWIDPFARPLRVRGGRADARLALRLSPGLQGSGEIELRDLALMATDGGDEGEEVARLGRLALRLRAFTVLPPRLWLESAELDEPRLALRREARGLEPLGSLAAGDETSVRARAALARLGDVLGEAPPVSLAPVDVEAKLRRGRLRFLDEVVPEPVAIELDDVRAAVEARGGPPWARVRGRLGARLDGAVPLALHAEVVGERLEVAGEIGATPLDRWDSYLASALGTVARRGTGRGSFELVWDERVRASSRLELAGLALERRGPDRFRSLLGVPLGRAFELAEDGDGSVALSLQIEGNAERPALGLPAALPEAFADALADAVSAPLFRGSEDAGGGRGSVRLAPLSFVPGDVKPAPVAARAIERLGVLLRREPALAVSIEGRVGDADAALIPVDDALRALGAARAEAVRAGLVETFGIEPGRVSAVEPAVGGSDARVVLRALPAAALERAAPPDREAAR